jgi:hypothetical protein
MPVVIGLDGHTHLTTFEDATRPLCGEAAVKTSARMGDLVVTHAECRRIDAERRGCAAGHGLFGGRYFDTDFDPLADRETP